MLTYIKSRFKLAKKVSEIETLATEAESARVKLARQLAALKEMSTLTNELAIPTADRIKLAYQESAQWVRMVNTTIWTLNTIFLAGSIVAFNSVQGAEAAQAATQAYQIAQGPPAAQAANAAAQAAAHAVLLSWRHMVGWTVLVLCIVWFIADLTYTISASRARTILKLVEENFAKDLKLFTSQTGGKTISIQRFFLVASYAPMVGIAWLAWFRFVQAN